MNIKGKYYCSIWLNDNDRTVGVLDQQQLPHKLKKVTLKTWKDAAAAISDMTVRGAPLIGITGASGLAMATNEGVGRKFLIGIAEKICETRPTAINLRWAVNRVLDAVLEVSKNKRKKVAWQEVRKILRSELLMSGNIGKFGARIIMSLYDELGRSVGILTHCNAGWLATVDWGTATAGIYVAYNQGVPLHVYAGETRPRIQGAMTAWELSSHGVPVELIADNAAGYMMKKGLVDMVVVGADRIAFNGDTANKIGTYLKALAAKDNGIPFYVAAPSSTFDWNLESGESIPIEERDGNEIRKVKGMTDSGQIGSVWITEPDQLVRNPAFDVTPAKLITAFITDKGIFTPEELYKLREMGDE